MEIIKKQISIDACRSHKQGLLPFIHNNGKPLRIDKNGEITYKEKDDDEVINELIKDKNDNLIFINSATTSANTNYGHFVCDLKLENGEVIKYLDIIRRYNELKEIIRNGIFCEGKNGKLKIIENEIFELPNGETFTCCEKEDADSAQCNCNKDIYEYIYDEKGKLIMMYFSKDFYNIKPLNINDFINKDGRYYEHISGESLSIYGCCVLINNYNIYEEYEEWGKNNGISSSSLGGYFTFIQYVENNLIYGNNPGEFDLITPTVGIPILLEEEYSIDTMYYPYEYTYSGEGTIIKINGEEYSGITGEEIVEISDASLVTNNSQCDYVEYKEDEKIYSGNIYTIKSAIPITVESKLQTLIHPTAINFGYNSDINDDIFGIPSGEPKMIDKDGNIIEDKSLIDYKKVLFKSGISSEGYYLVEYYNNEDIDIINIPFLIGEPINVEENKCDVVDKITYENGYAIIDYILGARLNEDNTYQQNNGIKYREKLILASTEIYIEIDNIKYTVIYKYINYDTNLESVYNDEYKTYIDIRKAEIIGIPIGSIYNIDKPIEKKEDGEWKIQKPLIFTKEGSDSLISTPKIDIDLTFNRGNAAGWEKHFKLSECNTMQDLENYGNNFFNL